ncbi:hypothetical protein CDO73_08725 [Saccharibacillus sp. O23]|nr:hypothetical protein CDO73_08725 [Saccharibacillus sp. O23]
MLESRSRSDVAEPVSDSDGESDVREAVCRAKNKNGPQPEIGSLWYSVGGTVRRSGGPAFYLPVFSGRPRFPPPHRNEAAELFVRSAPVSPKRLPYLFPGKRKGGSAAWRQSRSK